jgi:hypothetical protein
MHGVLKKPGIINDTFVGIVSINMIDNLEPIEIRKIQALTGERSLTLVFPKQFAVELGITKGDFMKCHVSGKKLVVEKVKP